MNAPKGCLPGLSHPGIGPGSPDSGRATGSSIIILFLVMSEKCESNIISLKQSSVEDFVVCNSSKNSFEVILQKWNCRLWDFFFYFDKEVQEDNDDKDKVCPQIWSKLQ